MKRAPDPLATRWVVAAAIAFPVVLVTPGIAHAREEPQAFSIGSKPVWFLLGGATVGGTLLAQDRGWYVGGEASVARVSKGGRFFGLYGDGYYDFGARRTYATFGPELGYKWLGLDTGAAVRMGGERVEWGPTGRLFVTLGLLAIYGRYSYFVDAARSDNEHVVQIGALVKMPLAMWGLQ